MKSEPFSLGQILKENLFFYRSLSTLKDKVVCVDQMTPLSGLLYNCQEFGETGFDCVILLLWLCSLSLWQRYGIAMLLTKYSKLNCRPY